MTQETQIRGSRLRHWDFSWYSNREWFTLRFLVSSVHKVENLMDKRKWTKTVLTSGAFLPSLKSYKWYGITNFNMMGLLKKCISNAIAMMIRHLDLSCHGATATESTRWCNIMARRAADLYIFYKRRSEANMARTSVLYVVCICTPSCCLNYMELQSSDWVHCVSWLWSFVIFSE